MKLRTFLSLAAASSLTLAGVANAATITFDEYAANNNNMAITTLYSALGILFSSDNSGTFGGNGNGAALEPQGDASSRRLCTLRENDSAHVRFVMDATGGNRREAARILGITLRQLQRKLAEMKGAS